MKKLFPLYLWLLFAQTAASQKLDADLIIPVGHTAGITAVDVSPNGRFLLTGSLDYRVKLWDWAGYEIRTFVGHKRNVLAVAFSPATTEDPEGGARILTGSSDHSAILWNNLGQKLAEFKEPADKGEVSSVAFSPDGKSLLIGLRDGTARLLNDSCRETLRFQHKNEVNAVAFSPGGKLLVAAGKDNTATLWRSNDASRPQATFAHTSAVLCVAFSRSGDTLLTACADGTATLWKINGSKIRTFQHAKELNGAAISHDGTKVATGSTDGTIKIWALADASATPLKMYDRGIRTLRFSKNDQFIVCGSEASNIAKISQLNGQTYQLLRGYTSTVTSLAISPDGASLLVGQADSTIKIWDLTSQKMRALRFPGRIESVALSPKTMSDTVGGQFALIGCEDRICRLQNLGDSSLTKLSPATLGAFSPNGKWALTGNTDGATRLWDLVSKKERVLTHSERRITALAFSPVGEGFAIGSYDGKVVYWETADAAPVSFVLSNASTINTLAFSPDGQSIVCGSEGGLTEIRDLKGQLRKDYPNRKRGIQNIRAVAFSPANKKGEQVLRASGNQAELWNIATGNIITFSGHISELTALAFSPEGEMVYTGSKDGAIKIWDAAAGKEIATLTAIGETEWAVTTPNGLYDASTAAMKLMHYTVGTDVVSLRQIKERYWEPGLLSKATGFNQDTVRAVTKFDNLALFPDVGMQIVGNKLEVCLTERSGGIGKLSFFINGKRLKSDINPPDPASGKRLKVLPPINLDEYANMYRTDTVNTIGLVSHNQENSLRSLPFELPYHATRSRGEATNTPTPAGTDCRSTQAKLYLIVVGTSKYKDASKNLTYPDQDAAAMAEALSLVGKAMLPAPGSVQLRLFTTSQTGNGFASKENIQAAFEEFAQKATPCDVFLGYFSGHGFSFAPEGKRSNFYYLTTGIASGELGDSGIREAHAISEEELEHWLTNIPAQKQALILDACHSGKAIESLKGIGQRDIGATQSIAMGLLTDRTGAFILTGSMADMLSWESSKFGQGLLTYSLLQGMSGPAVRDGKTVDISDLFKHARDQVPTLAESIGQVQTPVISGDGDSFPIGVIENVKINVPESKPVFIQSTFQLNGYILDTLEIGKALNDHFFEERLKGKDARYVYYNTSTVFADSYRVVGNYGINGDAVTLTANLFKGNKPVGEPFEVPGKKNDVRAIATGILKAITPRLRKK